MSSQIALQLKKCLLPVSESLDKFISRNGADADSMSLSFSLASITSTEPMIQVAFVALHVHGEALSSPSNAESSLQLVPKASILQNGCQILPTFNVDPLTAIDIQQLMERKAAAVAAENYDEAKALKSEIEDLKSTGSKILELEKR